MIVEWSIRRILTAAQSFSEPKKATSCSHSQIATVKEEEDRKAMEGLGREGRQKGRTADPGSFILSLSLSSLSVGSSKSLSESFLHSLRASLL